MAKRNRNIGKLNVLGLIHSTKYVLILLCIASISCQTAIDTKKETIEINKFIDNWHQAAAVADTSFFNYLDSDVVYIGTDATERWTKNEFVSFAMPYFKKGKAWNFKTRERKVYFADGGQIAWFNETLDTWMGICRSSGVLEMNQKHEWKIKQYHLSCTVPNEKVKQFIELIGQKEQ
jgi:hypothetical protein